MDKRNKLLKAVIGFCLLVIGLFMKHQQAEARTIYDCDNEKHRYEVHIREPATEERAGSRVYTCELCSSQYEEEIPALGHHFGEWMIEKEPDCVSEGLQVRICQDEAHEEEIWSPQRPREEEVLPAGQHNYVMDESASVPADCEQEGTQVEVCTGCGDQQEEVVPAPGHRFGEWQVEKSAGVLQEGRQVRICSNNELHKEEQIVSRGFQNMTTTDKVLATANTSNALLFTLLVRYDYLVITWNRRKMRKVMLKGLIKL